MNLYEILAIIAVVTFVIYAVFNVLYLIDLKRTSRAIRQFVRKTDENLDPALIELRLTLEQIRKVTGDASTVVDRLRAVTGAIMTVEKSVESLYGYYQETFGQATNANVAALKAGVKAGVVNFIKNLRQKKEGSA